MRTQVTLCMIIAVIMTFVGFFTLGLKPVLCPDSDLNISNWALNQTDHISLGSHYDQVVVQGTLFSYKDMAAMLKTRGINLTLDFNGRDLSRLFVSDPDPCARFAVGSAEVSTTQCTVPNPYPGSPALAPAGNTCPTTAWLRDVTPAGRLFLDWNEVSTNTQGANTLVVFNNIVFNLTDVLAGTETPQLSRTQFVNITLQVLNAARGTDATLVLSRSYETMALMQCLRQRYTVGVVGAQSVGCGAYSVIMNTALSVILGVIIIRFVMALLFHWVVSPKLTSSVSRLSRTDVGYLRPPAGGDKVFTTRASTDPSAPSFGSMYARNAGQPDDPYTILLVTCYSEGEAGIRSTLDSLAATDYPDDRKLLFVIADGLIKGGGEAKTTPEYLVDMIQHDESLGMPAPMSYLAIAHGEKQHNMAQVYAGYYVYRQIAVPIILVVKCGTPEQRATDTKKAGNRGKRDSQLILMNFLSRVTFNDRMTPLDYDLFVKIRHLTGVTADQFELLLMVDADTFVARDSLRYMVQAMKNDERVMGLCGETRIANKKESWVTMIQVYEYFTSHNLGKAFESLFGGVTCLPGCFCMYRIKATKGKSKVPLLVSPAIVEEYSENVVDTLHKKNLLLLGEDRFLSTLMLRNFPKRRMVFVPQALCHTTVPATFKVLLSQRRRWINSTIHNLLELVLLPELCGIFCLSMQFVIVLELIGTVALPAAVSFMYYLIFEAMFTGHPQSQPLILLAVSLGLPGALIMITTHKLVYVGWMFVYLVGLPVWNFILPLYSFWHFDDFSWGETRKVEGEVKQESHGGRQGAYEIGAVKLKK
nr:hypothetical protein HK105_005411 [Polyrhizophydium stewartii]